MFKRTFHNLSRRDGATRYCSLKKVFGIDYLVLAVEIKGLEHLFLEVSHRVVEIVKNLLRRLIDRLIDNPFLEKPPGDFLNQLDAEGIMGTDALYLLQFSQCGFQHPSQSLEPLDSLFGLLFAVAAR